MQGANSFIRSHDVDSIDTVYPTKIRGIPQGSGEDNCSVEAFDLLSR